VKELTPSEVAFLKGLKQSPNDFDCLTLRLQVEYFVRYLGARGDSTFTVDDLRALFVAADMKAPRSGKHVRPAASQLRMMLAALERTGAVSRQPSADVYELASPSP
jgi:hypothetical protein